MTRHISVQPRELEPGSSWWWWPHTVRLRLEDGSTREGEIVALRGSLARPLTPEEQQAKLAEAGKGVSTPEELTAMAEGSKAVSEQGIGAIAKWLRTAGYGQYPKSSSGWLDTIYQKRASEGVLEGGVIDIFCTFGVWTSIWFSL